MHLAQSISPREPSFSAKVRKCIDHLSKDYASSNYLCNGSSYIGFLGLLVFYSRDLFHIP